MPTTAEICTAHDNDIDLIKDQVNAPVHSIGLDASMRHCIDINDRVDGNVKFALPAPTLVAGI